MKGIVGVIQHSSSEGVVVSIEDDFLGYFPGKHVYCIIDDKKINQIPEHYHEGFDLTREQIIKNLHAKNKDGNGIFFCVNEINRNLDPGKQRTSKMLKSIRAIWADDDEIRVSPRTDFPAPPNIVVETSQGKFHYYWLTHTDKLDEWGYVMNGVANTFNTDGNAKDLVRVLRIPGFFHHKHEPFLSKAYLGDKQPYPWAEITSLFPVDDKTKVKPVAGRNGTHANQRFSNFIEAREAIKSGANFHGAIMWLLNHWVNCGFKDPAELKIMIEDLMQQSSIQDDRWEARMNDTYLSNNIKDAIGFVKDNPIISDVAIPEVELDDVKQIEIGYPCGLMGQFCEEIYEMAPHPNEEVALLTAFALTAGIVGRTYNVLGTGLNLYITLLADSGIGKANLKNSINRVLLKSCAMEGGITFRGGSRFTGPKALIDMLAGGLSKVCVLEESGLLSGSKAGDQIGLTRVMLDIYSSSGQGEYAGGENYSKQEHNIPVIPSPALTIANVSTPLSYLKALKAKDATVSGDIARVWMIRTMRDKHPLKMDRRKQFSEQVVARIKELVKRCIPQQKPESYEVIEMDASYINVQRDSDYWTDLENKYKHEGDNLKRTITSRAFLKIMKIASCASVFNGRREIGIDEYKWAKNAVNCEINMIEGSVTYGASDDMMATLKSIVVPALSKILNDKYDDVLKSPPKQLKGKGIFTATNVSQALRNNEVLKRMNDDPERPNPRSGVEKMIAFLVRSGLVTQVSEHQLKTLGTRTKIAYKVTEEFLLLMGENT